MTGTTYTNIRKLYEAGKAETAIEVSNNALQCDLRWEDRSRILELKGIAHHSLRQFNHARVCFEPLMDTGSLSASGILALGDCCYALGEQQTATELYRALADDDRTPAPLLASLARALSKSGEVERAVIVCRRAAALKPGCHHALFGVAFYMSKAGSDPATVLPLIERVIDLAPGIFSYRIAQISTLIKLQQHDKAYLAIADATPKELATVRCRCCLNRLISLFEDAGDQRRATFCRSQMDNSCGNCG